MFAVDHVSKALAGVRGERVEFNTQPEATRPGPDVPALV